MRDQVTSLANKLESLTASGVAFEDAWGSLTLKAQKTGQGQRGREGEREKRGTEGERETQTKGQKQREQ
eukprot:COSAG05_NODE_20178_length_282_cov_0.792350_1_plen_68_part_10